MSSPPVYEECLLVPYGASEVRRETLLVLAPHPDDEVFGCGGLSALVAAAGGRVVPVLLTDGGAGDFSGSSDAAEYVATRRAESVRAAEILGTEPPRALGFPDRSLPARGEELVAALVALFSQVRPDSVLVPSPAETHPDHRAAARAAHLAFVRAWPDAPARLVFYEVSAPLAPNRLVDVDAAAARKSAAIAAFASQLTERPFDALVDGISAYRAMTLPAGITRAGGLSRADPRGGRSPPVVGPLSPRRARAARRVRSLRPDLRRHPDVQPSRGSEADARRSRIGSGGSAVRRRDRRRRRRVGGRDECLPRGLGRPDARSEDALTGELGTGAGSEPRGSGREGRDRPVSRRRHRPGARVPLRPREGPPPRRSRSPRRPRLHDVGRGEDARHAVPHAPQREGTQFGYSIIPDPDDVPFNFFYTSNVSLPRGTFLALGGFDEEFPYAAWEDVEFAYRATRATPALRMVYRPAARTRHNHPTDPALLPSQAAKAGRRRRRSPGSTPSSPTGSASRRRRRSGPGGGRSASPWRSSRSASWTRSASRSLALPTTGSSGGTTCRGSGPRPNRSPTVRARGRPGRGRRIAVVSRVTRRPLPRAADDHPGGRDERNARSFRPGSPKHPSGGRRRAGSAPRLRSPPPLVPARRGRTPGRRWRALARRLRWRLVLGWPAELLGRRRRLGARSSSGGSRSYSAGPRSSPGGGRSYSASPRSSSGVNRTYASAPRSSSGVNRSTTAAPRCSSGGGRSYSAAPRSSREGAVLPGGPPSRGAYGDSPSLLGCPERVRRAGHFRDGPDPRRAGRPPCGRRPGDPGGTRRRFRRPSRRRAPGRRSSG